MVENKDILISLYRILDSRMKTVKFVIFVFVLLPMSIQAENTDSLKIGFMQQYRPELMTIEAYAESMTDADYESERDGRRYENGVVRDAMRARLRVSVPVWKNEKFSVSAGGFYSYHSLYFDRESIDALSSPIDMGNDHHLWCTSANLFYQGRLWGRPIIANANVMVDFSEYGFGKVIGFVTCVTPVIQNKTTYMGVGLVGLINTTSTWPVFPVFTLRHSINERMSIEVMPPICYFKYKLPSEYGTVAAGMSIDVEKFYVRPHCDDMPKECLLSRSFYKPEVVYEKQFGGGIKVTAKSGVAIPLQSYLYSRNGRRKYEKIDQDASCFFNVTVSCKLYKK